MFYGSIYNLSIYPLNKTSGC